jgi:hypothetical protein
VNYFPFQSEAGYSPLAKTGGDNNARFTPASTHSRMQREAGTNFGVCVEAGGIPEVVRYAALNHRADLVVIGRGVLPRFAGGFRSQAYPIVLDMPCPVLSV